METGPARQRDSPESPEQGPGPSLQHPKWQRLHLDAREGEDPSLGVYETDRGDLRGAQEHPVRRRGPARARGEAPDPGVAHHLRSWTGECMEGL